LSSSGSDEWNRPCNRIVPSFPRVEQATRTKVFRFFFGPSVTLWEFDF
jgi:hypothetical protein